MSDVALESPLRDGARLRQPANVRMRATAPFRSSRLPLLKLASVVVTLLLWEVFGRDVNPLFFSYPSAIIAVVPNMIRSGEIQRAILQSMQPFLVGWGIAITSGVLIGLLMGRYRACEAILDYQLTALYSAPTVALVPLFILWFGLGFEAKVAIVLMSAFFPIAINTQAGAGAVSKDVIDIARVERAREDQIFAKIILPASMPFIMTGIRLSVGRAVIGMVVAEMFTAITGLGGSIVLYSSTYRMDRLFVAVITLSLIGILLSGMIKMIERRVMPWRGRA